MIINLLRTNKKNQSAFDNSYAYYKFDEVNGQAIDSIGNNNADVFNVTQGAIGKINTGYSFSSNNQYLRTPINPVALGWDRIGFSCWFKNNTTNMGADNRIISIADDIVNSGTWLRLSIENGKIWIRVIGNVNYVGTFNDNLWHHLVVESPLNFGTTTDINVYVDNVKLTIDQDTQTPLNIISDDIYIGKQKTVTDSYTGGLDEYEIRNQFYTQAERDAMWNNGDGRTI